MVEFFIEIIAGVVVELVVPPLLRLLGSLLTHLFLFIVSPYLLLRGWLLLPRSYDVWELYLQGKQAAAHDVPYILSVMVVLPLVALLSVTAWQVVKMLIIYFAG